MTAGQMVNLCGSIFALSGSLAFVLVYSLFAPWWRNRIGRLLVMKATFISGFMVVSILGYVTDPETGRRVSVLLLVRGALAGAYGALMAYQAWFVSHAQLKGSRTTGTV